MQLLPLSLNTTDEAVWSIMATLFDTVSAHLCLKPFSIHWFHTHYSCSSMPCTSQNAMVLQTYFPETNHFALFELTHVLTLCPFTLMRHTYISFHFIWKYCTDWASSNTHRPPWCHNNAGPKHVPSLWKCTLVVHWSTHLPSLDPFRPFFLAVALFTKCSVFSRELYSHFSSKIQFHKSNRILNNPS